MADNRVKSKNLFNFRPAGEIDGDIQELHKAMMEGHDMEAMKEKAENMSDVEFGQYLRGMMESMMGSIMSSPVFTEAENCCDQSVLKVPTTHDGNYDVTVLVHAPKGLAQDKTRACIVYAHGGGAVAGAASQHKGFLSYMANNCGLVVFNVDYRLAPETRCPNNVLDFYSVVKYVSSHADDLGVDPSRVAIAGESGGGYICAGAMVHLARRGEGGLVKLAVPIIPMLSDYCFSDVNAMTREEAEHANGQCKIWRLIAGPEFETMNKDAILFPGKADDETLAKMPPTIIWESEFDLYITEATRFANRLRAAGRLLELVVIPGAKHGSGFMPNFAVFKVETEAWKRAMQEYLL